MKLHAYLLFMLLLLSPVLAQVYEVEVRIDEELYITSVNTTVGAANPAVPGDRISHAVLISDQAGQILVQENYFISDSITMCTEDTCETLNQAPDTLLYVPYSPRGELLTIQDLNTGQEVTRTITHLSNYCGNNVCNLGDTASSCPEDCLSTIYYFEQESSLNWLWIAGLVVLLLLLLLFVMRRKPASPSQNQRVYGPDNWK